MKEMEIKHICEREFFEMLIREEESSEMRKASQKLSSEQQKDRLFELKVSVVRFGVNEACNSG